MFSKKVVISMVAFLFAMLAFGYSNLESDSSTDVMFDGKEDHMITLEEGREYTARYRATIEPGEKLGGFFGREAIENIMAQEEAVGIRYYYGMDESGNEVMVLVGTDEDGQDMTDGVIAEKSLPCPPWCSNQNALNSELVIQ